jgi:hypothetical protein
MPSPITLEGRLLCASTHAYMISGPGDVPPTLGVAPNRRSDMAGYPTATGFVAGPDDRDAALIGDTPTEIILAFRGTMPPITDIAEVVDVPFPTVTARLEEIILDWSNDAYAELLPFAGGGRIHRGFSDSLSDLWTAMGDALTARLAARPGVPLRITGHSKGGGLAFLAAVLWRGAFVGHEVTVRTFAAPRVGDTSFATVYTAYAPDTQRFEFVEDIVPHLPATEELASNLGGLLSLAHLALYLYLNYNSVGQLKFIDKDGHISAIPPHSPTARFIDLLYSTWPNVVGNVAAGHGIGAGSGYAKAVLGG